MTERKRRELEMPESIDASPEEIAHTILNAGIPDDWEEFEEELERRHEEADE